MGIEKMDDFVNAVAQNSGSAMVHQGYAYVLSAVGKHDDAIEQARKAQELEPLSVTLKVTSGWFYYMARRYDDALSEWRKALELEPDVQRVQSGIVAALREQGKFEEARNEEIRYLRMIGFGQSIDALNSSDPQQALRNFYQLRLERLKILEQKGYVPSGYLAQTYANLNDIERLFDSLQRAFIERDIVISLLEVHPLFDHVRSEPRFQQLVLRSKVSDKA